MKAELERWTSQYLGGTISADGMASLNRLLEESAAARREFADWLDLDAALGDLAAGYESAAVESSRPVRLFPLPASARFLAAAAAIALLATGLLFLKSLASPYATVVGTTGVTDWGGKETLRGETITLSSGALQLLTPRGAEIVIEAPATFRFDSGERLHLLGGRLAADVPPVAPARSGRSAQPNNPMPPTADKASRDGLPLPCSVSRVSTPPPAAVHPTAWVISR